jgi:hypothetical protein
MRKRRGAAETLGAKAGELAQRAADLLGQAVKSADALVPSAAAPRKKVRRKAAIGKRTMPRARPKARARRGAKARRRR